MANLRNIVVFDFETDSPEPETCSITQIGAKVIAPRTLEFIPDATFNSMARPVDIDDEDYFEKHKSTIDYHAEHRGKTAEQIFESWKKAPPIKQVWPNFTAFVKRYQFKIFKESPNPIPAGHNIVDFDLPILERMCLQYGPAYKGEQNMFYKRDQVDLLPLLFMWFENNAELENFRLDTVSDYFGIKRKKRHDALDDVDATGQIIMRFMRLTRRVAETVAFKDSFKNVRRTAKRD